MDAESVALALETEGLPEQMDLQAFKTAFAQTKFNDEVPSHRSTSFLLLTFFQLSSLFPFLLFSSLSLSRVCVCVSECV